MLKKEIVKRHKNNFAKELKPRFIDPSKLSNEQLTDPDYALKQLHRQNDGALSITCSKCHHCR